MRCPQCGVGLALTLAVAPETGPDAPTMPEAANGPLAAVVARLEAERYGPPVGDPPRANP